MGSSKEINSWNEQWRSNPAYAQILTAMGVDPSKQIKLSKSQQKTLQSTVESQFGFKFPKGVEIDAAGNMNEDEGFGKQLKKWGPIIGQAALAIGTGGLSLPAQLAINAGVGAATGGLTGGKKGALLGGAVGAGSALGANYFGNLLKGAKGVTGAANTATSTADGLLATTTPEWATKAALSGAVRPAAGLGSMAGVTGAGMGGFNSIVQSLGKKALSGKGLDILSGALGKSSDAMASNRGASADLEADKLRTTQSAENNYFTSLLQKAAEQRASAGDAWKRMLQTGYLTSPANQRIQTPGFSTYSKPIAGPTANMVEMAGDPAMAAALKSRANFTYDPFNGATPTRTPDFSGIDKNMKMGGWEKLLGIGGTAAKIGSLFF